MRTVKPWHLIPEYGGRAAVLHEMLCLAAKHPEGDAFIAAYDLLSEAAPYPDEALVFETGYGVAEAIGIEEFASIGLLYVETWYGGRRRWLNVDDAVPLTPAAADFLAEIKAGAR